MTLNTLVGNGLIDIGQGCTLKGDSFTIYAHNDFVKRINILPRIEAPDMSVLNTVLNTSAHIYNFTPENHEQVYRQIMGQINDLKQQESVSDLSIHDIHQYSISYGILAILLLSAIVIGVCRIKRRRLRRVELARVPVSPPGGETPAYAEKLRASNEHRVRNKCSELNRSVSMSILSANRGSAPPKPPRSVSIPIPIESYGEIIRPAERQDS